jgi:hypothetical protein
MRGDELEDNEQVINFRSSDAFLKDDIRDIPDRLWEIKAGILKNVVFDPVIEEIMEMIDYQLENLNDSKKVDHLILVGGFGQSNKYLQKKVKDRFKKIAKNIIIPRSAELSVARGAVNFAMQKIEADSTKSSNFFPAITINSGKIYNLLHFFFLDIIVYLLSHA